MYRMCIIIIGLSAFLSCKSSSRVNNSKPAILVFTATKEFRHVSIPAGKAALLKLGMENNWQVDTTEDATLFDKEKLARYQCVVFINTTGNIFDEAQQVAFQQYIRNGGGFVGIHGASDTEKNWPWYNDLVGAFFKSHPKPQVARYDVVDKKFPATAFMPDTLRRLEEIYNFYNFKTDLVKVVMTVDEKSYTGGTMGDFHPVAWYHNFDGGKAFYTAWGHHPETFKEELFLKQITAAIKWAIKK